MKINITKKQYNYLVKFVEAASSVYGILGDMVSDSYKKQSDEIEVLRKYLLNFASDFDLKNITEIFRGELIMSDLYSEKLQKVIDDYNDETFWHELETRLGQRDFHEATTPKEISEMKSNGGWYPDRIHKIYEMYEKEFEKNGLKNLRLIQK